MTVGTQPTQATINQQLTAMALAMRTDLRNISNFQEYVVSLGLAGLEALGFAPADAQLVLNMASYMNTIAGVYFGTITQNSDFDFDNALCGLWAGQ
jgi:hypothetical protein